MIKSKEQLASTGSYQQLRAAVKALADTLPENVDDDQPLKDAGRVKQALRTAMEAEAQFQECHGAITEQTRVQLAEAYDRESA